MAFLSHDEAYRRYLALGRNSSHFVWMLAELRFFETSRGWVFGFTEVRDVTLLALEPLVPSAAGGYGDFDAAWKEFLAEVRPRVTAFVSVYAEFAEILKSRGFQSVQVGREPWMDLKDCIPTGNAGKGVRSARNQALHAGVTVEEWSFGRIEQDSCMIGAMRRLLAEWKSVRAIHLGGFLNAVDPFAHGECRRYFMARSRDGELQAYLIATPVPGAQGYFLEDMILRQGAPRGTGELLTLEAMVALRDQGALRASLGVVSLTTLTPEVARSAHRLPPWIRLALLKLPRALMALYPVGGLEVFRKRFKPHSWESIHLAVQNQPGSGISDTLAWVKTLFAILTAFRPRLQLTPSWVLQRLLSPLRRYPITAAAATINFTLFACVNRFGKLPEWALLKFGFTGSAPFSEWLTRSVVSDLLYFDAAHFGIWGGFLLFLIYWGEKTNKRSFFLPFLLSLSVLDDFVNYLVIIKPFQFFQPEVFHKLVKVKDVGGSLTMVALLGFQLCRFRKNREILFAILALGTVLGFAFSSVQLQSFVINLNHFLFLCVGYVAGKLKWEHDRARNNLTSRGKPPVAKSVAPAFKKAA